MKHRVSNAPKNLTRRFEARYRAQRQGQALLLAVVVMLFVALISAGFLATVAGNLNQTARTSEKNRAVEAARAGMTYINNRINSSAEGENWRPEMESPIPATTDPNYANYNLPIAQIQGLVSGRYSKFPTAKNDAADAPQFYAKVERIGYDATSRSANGQANEAERAGMLKITVVGLGRTDPNVFHRMVAYRGGYEGAPIGRVARAVSNFDFANKTVPVGTASALAAVGDTTITLANDSTLKGVFPEKNFAVIISSPNATSVQSVIASSYDKSSRTIILATSLTTAVAQGDRIELAANIGAPDQLDYDRDSVNETNITLDSATNTAPLSSRINGGVYWQGNLTMRNLQSKTTAYNTGAAPYTIESSGLMVAPTPVPLSPSAPPIVAGDTATSIVPNSTVLTGTQAEDDLVSDGRSRILGDLGPTRQVKSYNPPDLTSEANLARYRGLSRDSKPINAAYPTESSSYGYGQGIYIDNVQDREKVSTGTNVYREMTQQELVSLWTSTDTSKPEYRSPATSVTVLPPASGDASLEQKRLRGWIATDEFKPRGVTIELFDRAGVPTIGVTRDALVDGTNSANPSGLKAWKNTDGTPKTVTAGVATPSDFYEEFPLNSTNGVIFAEGNVRIKGNATSVTKSLTVVSLGNIYIEGSLGIDNDTDNTTSSTRKVLLLARKNVVVNPTTVISRPENYTLAQGASAPNAVAGFDIPVYETAGFNKGDYIQVPALAAPVLITAVDTATSTLTVDVDPTIAAGDSVRIAKETIDATRRNARLASFNAVLQRRMPTPVTAPVTQKVSFRHVGEKRKAADVTLTVTPPTTATSADLFIKSLVAPTTQGVVASAEKSFSLVEDGAAQRDVALYATTTPFIKTLSTLLTDTNSGAPADWSYNFAYSDPLMANVPSIALAGVGNYRRNGLAVPSTRADWDTSIYPTPATPASIYLATSVTAKTLGTTADSTIGPIANNIKGFGFNPDYLVNEDALTSDQAFYEDDASATVEQNILPDSRDIVLPASDTPQSTFSFKLNTIAGLVDDTVALPTDPLPANRIPAYNLFGMRLDSPNADGSGAGYILKIDAYVYAQTGSWVVIPGGYFDPNVKNVALDITRDGDTADVGEATPAIRYARYNYGIEFKGAIAENYTPVVNDTGTVKGAVKDWMDKWSYPTTTTATGTWQPIKYQFDPDYASGKLDADPTIDPSTAAYKTGPQAGFYMPVANDILYQE